MGKAVIERVQANLVVFRLRASSRCDHGHTSFSRGTRPRAGYAKLQPGKTGGAVPGANASCGAERQKTGTEQGSSGGSPRLNTALRT